MSQNQIDEFPFHCQTKTNTIRNEKGLERNFIINFSINQQSKQNGNKIEPKNKTLINKNEKVIKISTTDKNDKSPINDVKSQQIILTDPKLLSSSSSLVASSRPNIPSLPSSTLKHKRKFSKVTAYQEKIAPFTTSSNRNFKRYPALKENSSTDDDLDQNAFYSDITQNDTYNYQSQYDYDFYYSETDTQPNQIHFVNDESFLSTLSEFSENESNDPGNQKNDLIPISQPKFCEIDDLTESFMKDINDENEETFIETKSPTKKENDSLIEKNHSVEKDDENDELVNILLSDITNEINRIQAKSKKSLAISDSLHIFIDNPVIQKIKGNIRFPNVHVDLPLNNSNQPLETKTPQKFSVRKPTTNNGKEGNSIQQTKEKFVNELVEQNKINANNAMYLNKLINNKNSNDQPKVDASVQKNNSQNNKSIAIKEQESRKQSNETQTLKNISDEINLSISKDQSSSENSLASNSVIKEFIKQNNEIIEDIKVNEKKSERENEQKENSEDKDTSIISTVLSAFENKKQSQQGKKANSSPSKTRNSMGSNSNNSSVQTSPEADTKISKDSTVKNKNESKIYSKEVKMNAKSNLKAQSSNMKKNSNTGS